MKLGVDSTSLGFLVNPDSGPPTDPATNEPVHAASARIKFLIQQVKSANGIVIIPTPVLAETLVIVGDAGQAFVSALRKQSVFRIAPFDEASAQELAHLTRQAKAAGSLKGGQSWQKVKFDRQIAAICSQHGATHLYTDDRALGNFALASGMEVLRTWDLRMPPADAQQNLFTD